MSLLQSSTDSSSASSSTAGRRSIVSAAARALSEAIQLPSLDRDQLTTTLALLLTKSATPAELVRKQERHVEPKHALVILVCPNPAIDVHPDGRLYLGGALGTIGSIFAARSIPTIPIGFLGTGPAGQLFRNMARDKGIDTSSLTPVRGECGFTIFTSRQAKISRLGPRTTKPEIDALLTAFSTAIREADTKHPPLVIMSGSIPSSETEDANRLYHDLIHLLRALQANHREKSPVWVDARGPVLSWALQAKPDYVKINHQELAELIDRLIATGQSPKTIMPPRTRFEALACQAKHVVTTFCLRELTVTMEKRGALTAWPHTNHVHFARVIRALAKPHTAGLGDTLLATQAIGEVMKQHQHRSLEFGVAAARASAGLIGTTLVTDPLDILSHLPQVRRATLDITDALRPPQNLRELRRAVTKRGVHPVIIADMDGTLTRPRQRITTDIITALRNVLDTGLSVVILTSSGIEAVHTQVLADLCTQIPTDQLKNVYIFAAQGSQAYYFPAGTPSMEQLFLLDLADPQVLGPQGVQRVTCLLNEAAKYFDLPTDEQSLVENRSSQITMMILGRDATPEAKEIYDNNGGETQRAQIADYLNRRFADDNLRVMARPGGKSSINIAAIGVDKAFGIKKIAECLGVSASQMIYIADEFWPGGVDAPVIGHVLATINVGPSLAPTASEQHTIIDDVSLGTLGTKEVLTMLAATQRRTVMQQRAEDQAAAAA